MANDKSISLPSVGYPNRPAIENLQWHDAARKGDVHRIYSAQDRPVAASRRILCRYGMSGEAYHKFGDYYALSSEAGDAGFAAEGDGAIAIPYPFASNERELIEVDGVPLTPGCVLDVRLVALPSGPCWEFQGTGDPTYQGAQGSIRIDVVWDDGTTTDTTTVTIDVPGDTSDTGYPDDLAGNIWKTMRDFSRTIMPGGFTNTKGEATQWSQSGVTAKITVTAVGNPRVMDLCVYEKPLTISRENGSPAGPAHIYSSGATPLTALPDDYPIDGESTGDIRFGAQYALDVARQHEVDLGPALFTWTSEREGYGSREYWAGTDTPAIFDGTSEWVLGESAAGTDTDDARFGVGCGAYGRQHATSDPLRVMAENGVCPIIFGVYWSVEGGTGTIRLASADYSELELSTTSTTYTWDSGITHLAVGAHPLDGFRARVSGENSGANETRVRYAWAAYWPVDS